MNKSVIASALWCALGLAHCGEAHPPYESSRSAARDPSDDAGVVDVMAPLGPLLAQNPVAAPSGFATQHGDTGASNCSPLAGPGSDAVATQIVDLFAACPSLLPTADGLLLAVCTQLTTQAPAVFLLDATSGGTLATLALAKGNLYGGVYPYLDAQDRLLVVDGTQTLLVIGHHQSARGWTLSIDDQLSIGGDEGVVGLVPGYDGRVWFATTEGSVGVAELASHHVDKTHLPDGEHVDNSIASAPSGTAVVSDHALYLFTLDADGKPVQRARAEYDRGPARKPGQLSWGSGSTPTFFGPNTGSEYVAITDNARPEMNLWVFHADSLSQPVCKLALPPGAGDGSESSPIGSGRSVFVNSTYGYPYPALPDDAGPSDPASAPFVGGMARVDLAADASGCALVWTNDVRSAAVPKLSRADDLIYTVARVANESGVDGYSFTTIDPDSGQTLGQQTLFGIPDTMQLAGTLANQRVFYQGTMLGMLRIAP